MTRPAYHEAETFGRYQCIEAIGSGGMGIVSRARDLRLRRDVAIKRLRPELAGVPEIVDRFAAESIALARVDHPNVVRVLDLIEDPRAPAYVMELPRGRSVAAMLRDGVECAALPELEIGEILIQSADALAAVHRLGMIHRDVKPSNLFLAHDAALGERVVVKLLDFGIALVSGAPRLTRVGDIVGTARYMAPNNCEQVRSTRAPTCSRGA